MAKQTLSGEGNSTQKSLKQMKFRASNYHGWKELERFVSTETLRKICTHIRQAHLYVLVENDKGILIYWLWNSWDNIEPMNILRAKERYGFGYLRKNYILRLVIQKMGPHAQMRLYYCSDKINYGYNNLNMLFLHFKICLRYWLKWLTMATIEMRMKCEERRWGI